MLVFRGRVVDVADTHRPVIADAC